MISCLYTLRLALVWQQRTRLWSLEPLLQHDTCDAVCPRVWCWWSRPEQLYICSSRTLSALKPRINPADSSISKLGTKIPSPPLSRKTASGAWRYGSVCGWGSSFRVLRCECERWPEAHRGRLCGVCPLKAVTHTVALSLSLLSADLSCV